jgi:hypothetical protein
MDEAAIAERRNALQAQMQNMNDNDLERLILNNQEAYDLIDRTLLAELTIRTESRELSHRARNDAMACINELHACIQDGINVETEPPFADIVRDIYTLSEVAATGDDLRILAQFILGDITTNLNAARLQYQQNKENHA